MTIRTLTPDDLGQVVAAYQNVFAHQPQYAVVDKQHFTQKYINRLRMDYTSSVGLFAGQRVVGFILNSVGQYGGCLTAYNGGTGVAEAYRGHAYTEQMYQSLWPTLLGLGVRQCILEVLADNDAARHVYQKIGFGIKRQLVCFYLVAGVLAQAPTPAKVAIRHAKPKDFQPYAGYHDTLPSFLDCQWVLQANRAGLAVIEAHRDGRRVGYAVYEPAVGRVSRLAVDPSHRRRGIGTAMMRYLYERCANRNLAIMNLDSADTYALAFLRRLGFQPRHEQYEMAKPLS